MIRTDIELLEKDIQYHKNEIDFQEWVLRTLESQLKSKQYYENRNNTHTKR